MQTVKVIFQDSSGLEYQGVQGIQGVPRSQGFPGLGPTFPPGWYQQKITFLTESSSLNNYFWNTSWETARIACRYFNVLYNLIQFHAQLICALCPLDNVFRSSHWRCLVKKGVFKNFAKSTRKYLCWSLFLIKQSAWRPATLLKRDSNKGVFMCVLRDFWEHHFYRKPPDGFSNLDRKR